MKGSGKTIQAFYDLLEEYRKVEKHNRIAREYLERVLENNYEDKVDIAYLQNVVDILNGNLECMKVRKK